ncbi:hypothetical protein S7335_2120 [Synechococcus sp. PCC 7335]|nr:hypothetical protein S7335_2120 [Synechococcus sp. PCC 7335]
MAYVAKKDLEQEVTQKARADEDHVLTLANGWELQIAGLDDPIQTPQTVRAKRVK